MTTLKRRTTLSILLSLSIILTILAFLPFTDRPSFENRDAFTTNRIIEILLLMISASSLTATAIAFRIGLRFDRTPVYLLGFFSLWALLSTVWSDSPLYTFGKSLELIVLVYITALISAVSAHCANYNIDTLRTKLPRAMLIAGLIVIVATFLNFGTPFIFDESSYRTARLSIGTTHPLQTADFISLTIITVVASSFTLRVKAIGAILLVIPLILTDGRSPAAVLSFSIFSIIFKKFRNSKSRLLFTVCTLFSVTMIILLLSIFGEEKFYRLPEDFYTLNNRTLSWKFALDIAIENSLIGVGYFSGREYLVNFFTYGHAWGGPVHNSYIEIFLTTGIIGVVILIVFLVYGIRKSIRGESILLVGVFIYVVSRGILNAILFSPGLPMFVLMLVLMAGPAFEEKSHQFSGTQLLKRVNTSKRT